MGGGRIGGRGGRDESVHRPVPETPAERRACIVCFEAHKYTNHGVTLPPSLALYAANYVACFLSNDEAEEGHVIGPEDFVKDEAEEACGLAEALAQTAKVAAAEQTAEEVGNRTAFAIDKPR
jgi:hypothetical protein